MSETHTMTRSSISIDDSTFSLAQGDIVDELCDRIESAVHAGGLFVDFTVVGNRSVRVLITPTSSVTVSTETVEYDVRDNGDLGSPFGSRLDDFV